MKFDIRLEREFAHPVERLWWALTDRDALASWFMQTDICAVLGAKFTIRGAPEGAWRGWTACQILKLEPMRRVVWSFACEDGYKASIVTFELRPTKAGTVLSLRHEGQASSAILSQIGQSWPHFLERLADSMDGAVVNAASW